MTKTKIIISLLFATLLFSACVENGQVFIKKHIPVKSTNKVYKIPSKTHIEKKPLCTKTIKQLSKTKIIKKTSQKIVDLNRSIHKIPLALNVHNTMKLQEKGGNKNTLFQLPLNDDMKNNISGFFIILIGLMILF